MKILVIGDTHRKLDKVRDVWKKLHDIDLLVHTGDHISDGEALAREFNIPVVAVKGNCDGSFSSDDSAVFDTEYGRILVTHGHMENVKYHLNALMYKAMEADCKAVLFGHSHCALIQESNGIHFINPGSLTQPRDGSSGSYAIVRTTENSFDASIVYYSTIMGSPRKKHSGFLRNLMNNSDRF